VGGDGCGWVASVGSNLEAASFRDARKRREEDDYNDDWTPGYVVALRVGDGVEPF